MITALDSDEGCGFMIVKCNQMAYNRIRLKRRCTMTKYLRTLGFDVTNDMNH